jgi:amidophosphoribosyltransferase
MADDLGEKCAIFGVYGHPEAAKLAYLGLYALQHRGQESSGIVSSDGTTLHAEIGMGLVADVFNERRLAKLPGHMAIGHNRYSTTGSSLLRNAQPMVISYAGGSLAIAHNGNLVNATEIRRELEQRGAIFRSTTDTEVVVHLMARSAETALADQVVDALRQVRGAYSLLLMTEREMIGVRDSFGFRPLALGRLGNEAYVLASETCALDLIEAEYVRDVEPGEMVVIRQDGVECFHPFPPTRQAFCIFEFIYFARPDSIIFEKNVYPIRKALGRQLAREAYVEADVVVPVPDSGVPAALGYAEEAGIPFEMGLIRNHYVGRTFIEPQQAIRHFGAKVKLNPVKHFLRGKRVVVVDDSIVRGTTGQKIVSMLKNAGAKEVHVRISSPPSISPCFYGIDTPSKRELIASNQSVEEICAFLGADSLAYLSLNGLLQTVSPDGHRFCTACFTGDYPAGSPAEELLQLELF